jgi:glycogen(starch) synthase
MKLCFLSQEYLPHSRGGIGVSVSYLAKQLAKEHEVIVVTQSITGFDHSYVDEGVCVYAVHPIIVRIPLLNIVLGDFVHKLCYNVRVYFKLKSLGKEWTLHAAEFGFEGLLPALMGWRVLTRLATPTFVDDFFNRGKVSLQNKMISWCEKRQVLLSKKIIAQTTFIREFVAQNWHIDSRAISVVYNAVPKNTEKYVSKIKGTYVLFVGRIDKRKGADILLKAIERVVPFFPELRFVFIGRDLMRMIETYQKNNSLSVIIHYPVVEHTELLGIMQNASLVVVPSRFENCSMVCLESLALGKPLIITENTGAAELIEPGVSGFTFPYEDYDALATTIKRCLASDMKTIGRNALKRAHFFDPEKIQRENEQIMTGLL